MKGRSSFSELYFYRYVLIMLSVRDIKLRYKQTLLGVIWVIFQPLLTAGLFALLFRRGLQLPHTSDSYFLFTYAALIPWMVFSQSLSRAGPSLINDAQLVTKVYFPRIFIPLSATLGLIVDYLIALTLGCAIALFQGVSMARAILWLPLASLYLFILCAAINLSLAALNVYFRDLKHIIPFFIQLGMFASPIVYSIGEIPSSYLWLYQCNPLVGIIELYRFLLTGSSLCSTALIISCTVTFVIGCASLLLFQKLERNFADVI